MRILILGGDGYLGWPTAMYLSNGGHNVTVVDNYFRRNICKQLSSPPLFPVGTVYERAQLWKEHSGYEIAVIQGDITDYEFLSQTFQGVLPEAIVHYAEQPSAPYSMLGYEQARFTLSNNLIGTLNVAFAAKEIDPDIHIVKLGTMGEYGTPNIDIEEGFLEIVHKGRQDRLIFPRQANSIYHTTKIQDTDLLYFFVRNSGLRVTDLMQGPVYGLMTPEMDENVHLSTFFNYDSVFGTVLNRFMVQAVVDRPLTVYGSGGQNRGYLNLIDTLQCVRLAIENPSDQGELKILNQFTETYTVLDLADKVVDAARALGIKATIKHIDNPRFEKEDHYYNPSNDGLLKLGLIPHLLDQDVLVEMMTQIEKHKVEIRQDNIQPEIRWC